MTKPLFISFNYRRYEGSSLETGNRVLPDVGRLYGHPSIDELEKNLHQALHRYLGVAPFSVVLTNFQRME